MSGIARGSLDRLGSMPNLAASDARYRLEHAALALQCLNGP